MNESEEQEIKIFYLIDKILNEARERETILRLMGGVAVRIHCPKYKYIHYKFGRRLPDIDFVGYLRQVVKIQRIFLDIGFEEDKNVMRLFGTQRRIFDFPDSNIHSDVVLDKLHFCHDIDLRKRLEIDSPTITLADLLLSKLQIFQLNEKDTLDIVILLLEHEIGNNDNETVNIGYISKLCAHDWELWKTITSNLTKIENLAERYLNDSREEVENLNSKIQLMLRIICEEKKSFRWRLRSRFGESIKWYREVEELER